MSLEIYHNREKEATENAFHWKEKKKYLTSFTLYGILKMVSYLCMAFDKEEQAGWIRTSC